MFKRLFASLTKAKPGIVPPAAGNGTPVAGTSRRVRPDRGHAAGLKRPRLVIDTNVFVAAISKPGSASAKLLAAVAEDRAVLLVSPPVFLEYQRVLSKAVRTAAGQTQVRAWIAKAETVDAGRGDRLVADDPSDDKFLALAIAGGADAVVTSDRHLHAAADRVEPAVLRPTEAERLLDP